MLKDCVKIKSPTVLSVLTLLLFMVGLSSAQVSRTLNVGNLRFSANENMNGDNILWPNLWDQYGHINNDHLQMLHTYGVAVGQVNTWTDAGGVTWDRQVAQAIASKYVENASVLVPVSGAFKRTFKYPYPDKILDGTNWTPTTEQTDPVDPNLPSDAMIYGAWDLFPNFDGGLKLERWVYSFVNKDYTDIIYHEFVVSNTSGKTRNGVYFALNSQTSAHDYYGAANRWGNYYGVTYWQNVAGDATADSLRMWYSWDSDLTATPEDEKGNPDSQWGNLEEPQVFSFSVVHADKSPSDESDDPRQPFKVQQAQRDKWPDLNQATHPAIYKFISKEAPVDETTQYSVRVDSTDSESGNGMYEHLIPGFDERDFDSLTEQEKSCMMSFGPYTLAPGEDVRIVVAYTGGTISQKLAIDAGRAYDAGYPQRAEFGVNPMPYDIVDLQGNTIASAGATLSMAQKDEIINNISRSLCFNNAGKALDLWKRSSVKMGSGSFDMKAAPASPNLTGESQNDQIYLSWSSNGGNPVAYRIYREYKRQVALTEPTDTLWYYDQTTNTEYIETTGTEYIDTNVIRGEQYYYYITAINADGVESSMFQNRTGTSGTPSDEALAPTRAPDANWQDNVVVVPNPYHASGADKYGGRRLNFLNLPAYCNIHIYTMTGDLIQTLEHVTGTGDEDWQRQDTFSTMEIVSGVYIYVVEETDATGGATGEKAIGKFVVVK